MLKLYGPPKTPEKSKIEKEKEKREKMERFQKKILANMGTRPELKEELRTL